MPTKQEREPLTFLGAIDAEPSSKSWLQIAFHGHPHLIRAISTTFRSEDVHHKRFNEILSSAMNMGLTAIRLSHAPEAQPAYQDSFGVWVRAVTESDDVVPVTYYPIGQVEFTDYRVPVDEVCRITVGISRKELRDIAILIAEARHPSSPLHFSYLSLFRALELLCPSKAKRGLLFDRYQEKFALLNISDKQFRNFAPQFRDKCAHGTGSRERNSIHGVAYDGKYWPVVRLMNEIVEAEISKASFAISASG